MNSAVLRRGGVGRMGRSVGKREGSEGRRVRKRDGRGGEGEEIEKCA